MQKKCNLNIEQKHLVKEEHFPHLHILSVNEKLPFLQFRYFENYKRNRDSYFTFRVSGRLQTCLEQCNRSPSPAAREQLLHVHFVLFAIYQNVKTLFSKTNVPVYAWKIFLENAIEMVSIFDQIEQARLRLSGTTTTWQVPIDLNGNIWCSLAKGYRTFMYAEHRFLYYRFIGLYTAKNENWTDGNSLSRKIQTCSCVKCTRVNGNFSLMLSIYWFNDPISFILFIFSVGIKICFRQVG